MTSQIPLPLGLHDENTFSNYHSIGNEQLLQTLQKTAFGRGEQFIYMWGAPGTGKSHLLQASCHAAHQEELRSFYLSLKTLDQLHPKIFQDLETLNLICIDDIQGVAGKAGWEEAFLHLLNRIKEERKRLIIAGNLPTSQLNIQLQDLLSRLNVGVTFHTNELSDEEKIKALKLRADRLGFSLPEPVAQFIFKRCHRNMSFLFSILMELDKISLEEKRRLTIPFVKSVLGI